jgi:hypothetical protein
VWIVGDYPSDELKSLATSWITTPAASSVTVSPTITDMPSSSQQAFRDVGYPHSFNFTTSSTYTSEVYSSWYVYPEGGAGKRPGRHVMAMAMVVAFLTIVLVFVDVTNVL